MTPQLIGLTGRAGSGKDTIALALHAFHDYARVAFADALKTAAYESNPFVALGTTGYAHERLADVIDAHGWDEAKRAHPDVRRYLQRYGMALRDLSPGVWVNIAVRRIEALQADGAHVVVTDVRFPDEVAAIRRLGGYVARIDRPGIESQLGVNAAHVSEQVEALDVDAVAVNDGPLGAIPTIARDLHHAGAVAL